MGPLHDLGAPSFNPLGIATEEFGKLLRPQPAQGFGCVGGRGLGGVAIGPAAVGVGFGPTLARGGVLGL